MGTEEVFLRKLLVLEPIYLTKGSSNRLLFPSKGKLRMLLRKNTFSFIKIALRGQGGRGTKKTTGWPWYKKNIEWVLNDEGYSSQ